MRIHVVMNIFAVLGVFAAISGVLCASGNKGPALIPIAKHVPSIGDVARALGIATDDLPDDINKLIAKFVVVPVTAKFKTDGSLTISGIPDDKYIRYIRLTPEVPPENASRLELINWARRITESIPQFSASVHRSRQYGECWPPRNFDFGKIAPLTAIFFPYISRESRVQQFPLYFARVVFVNDPNIVDAKIRRRWDPANQSDSSWGTPEIRNTSGLDLKEDDENDLDYHLSDDALTDEKEEEKAQEEKSTRHTQHVNHSGSMDNRSDQSDADNRNSQIQGGVLPGDVHNSHVRSLDSQSNSALNSHVRGIDNQSNNVHNNESVNLSGIIQINDLELQDNVQSNLHGQGLENEEHATSHTKHVSQSDSMDNDSGQVDTQSDHLQSGVQNRNSKLQVDNEVDVKVDDMSVESLNNAQFISHTQHASQLNSMNNGNAIYDIQNVEFASLDNDHNVHGHDVSDAGNNSPVHSLDNQPDDTLNSDEPTISQTYHVNKSDGANNNHVQAVGQSNDTHNNLIPDRTLNDNQSGDMGKGKGIHYTPDNYDETDIDTKPDTGSNSHIDTNVTRIDDSNKPSALATIIVLLFILTSVLVLVHCFMVEPKAREIPTKSGRMRMNIP
eukprot:142720_1